MITPLQVTFTRARGDSIQVGPVTITASDPLFTWETATAAGMVRDRVDGTVVAEMTVDLSFSSNVLTVSGVVDPADSAEFLPKNYFGDIEVRIGDRVLTPVRFILQILPDATY